MTRFATILTTTLITKEKMKYFFKSTGKTLFYLSSTQYWTIRVHDNNRINTKSEVLIKNDILKNDVIISARHCSCDCNRKCWMENEKHQSWIAKGNSHFVTTEFCKFPNQKRISYIFAGAPPLLIVFQLLSLFNTSLKHNLIPTHVPGHSL